MLLNAIAVLILCVALTASSPAMAQQLTETRASLNDPIQATLSIDHAQDETSVVAHLSWPLNFTGSTDWSLLHSSYLTTHTATPSLMYLSRQLLRDGEAARRSRDRANTMLNLNNSFQHTEASSSALTDNRFVKRLSRLFHNENSATTTGQHNCQGGSIQIAPIHCSGGPH